MDFSNSIKSLNSDRVYKIYREVWKLPDGSLYRYLTNYKDNLYIDHLLLINGHWFSHMIDPSDFFGRRELEELDWKIEDISQ